jgi:transcriptional regulator with XRE-family HTH domain
MKQKKSSLRTIRQLEGFSQGELSKLSGINRRAISFFETGRRKPNTNHKKKLCEALDIESVELIFPEKKMIEPFAELFELKSRHLAHFKILKFIWSWIKFDARENFNEKIAEFHHELLKKANSDESLLVNDFAHWNGFKLISLLAAKYMIALPKFWDEVKSNELFKNNPPECAVPKGSEKV